MRLDTNRERLLFPKKSTCPTCQPIQSSKNVSPCPGCLEVGVVNLKLFFSRGESRESYDLRKRNPRYSQGAFFIWLKNRSKLFLDRKTYLNDDPYCLVKQQCREQSKEPNKQLISDAATCKKSPTKNKKKVLNPSTEKWQSFIIINCTFSHFITFL